ncbi:hypothetical protein C0Q70_14778 [Pomacea canaliculata]|uniref:Autocrine proliferation repressor protein A n=1 Tax=Pomacea canaliculata TaxID=400727 RepID=A0A2T7NT43_POMCA|nr:hypothetical protein C0Q70_14778 [Pomacea canaliculata]
MILLMMMSMQGAEAAPLDDYVNRPDPFYSWTTLNWSSRGPTYTLFAINMTSQMWLTDAESSQATWWHYLYVVVPDRLTNYETALLYIGLGNNPDSCIPAANDPFISFATKMADSTGSVCAVLNQVPNQPIVFNNDPNQAKRFEDAILAWSWYQFINNNASVDWLTVLPMTKAAVRAMDTITAFANQLNPSHNINKFVVSGASKRGWTTWLTGAVDRRVVAIVPIVMDLLNITEIRTDAEDREKDTKIFSTFCLLCRAAYKDRLTMPKYIITAGGDEFFLPDNSYYYLDQMLGETYLRTVPNIGHSLTFQTALVYSGVQAFYLSVVENTRRPNMTWTMKFKRTGGVLTMFTDTIPVKVEVHYAKTVDGVRRDFRASVLDPTNPGSVIPHPVFWNETKAVAKNSFQYRATFRNPKKGWLIFHIQAFFDGPKGSKFEFTTENMIIPNRLPFPRCQGEACHGMLL